MMRQSAISSASSSTRWIEPIVASMLTTTPFLSPRDGCVPRPMTLRPLSGSTSATIATIFEVPMSSPTIRLSFSFTFPLSPSRRLARCFFTESRHPRGKAAAIAQIDTIDLRARTRQHADGPPIDRDEAREPAGDVVAADGEPERAACIRGGDLTAAARRQRDAGELERKWRKQRAPRAVALRHQRRLPFGTCELREFPAERRDEHLAACVDQRAVFPARERLVLGHLDLEPARPLPAQRHHPHPG